MTGGLLQNFESLNRNKDFLRLYHRGKSVAKSGIVVYGMKNRLGVCRVGITSSKKIGNAVQRNRARRVIRAAWFQTLIEEELCGSWDFVFVARSKTGFLKSTAVKRQMADSLRSIGAIK